MVMDLLGANLSAVRRNKLGGQAELTAAKARAAARCALPLQVLRGRLGNTACCTSWA